MKKDDKDAADYINGKGKGTKGKEFKGFGKGIWKRIWKRIPAVLERRNERIRKRNERIKRKRKTKRRMLHMWEVRPHSKGMPTASQ